MRRLCVSAVCLFFALALAGCAGVKTYTYQEERPDQGLREGNRGYLKGDAPEPDPARKDTRTMLGIDVELPPSKEYKTRQETLDEGLERKRERAAAERAIAPRETPIQPKPEAPAEPRPADRERINMDEAEDIEYAVQSGDTLEKIAEKFLGASYRWPEIYEANRGILKAPSKIYPGQVIIIPKELFEAPVGEIPTDAEYK